MASLKYRRPSREARKLARRMIALTCRPAPPGGRRHAGPGPGQGAAHEGGRCPVSSRRGGAPDAARPGDQGAGEAGAQFQDAPGGASLDEGTRPPDPQACPHPRAAPQGHGQDRQAQPESRAGCPPGPPPPPAAASVTGLPAGPPHGRRRLQCPRHPACGSRARSRPRCGPAAAPPACGAHPARAGPPPKPPA